MQTTKNLFVFLIFIIVFLCPVVNAAANDSTNSEKPKKEKKKVVFIAGAPSHGKGEHEFKGGCTLLAKLLNEQTENINAIVYDTNWPGDTSVLADADAIVIYCDGGEGHMIIPHLEEIDKLMKQGAGLVLLHYAVELPKGEKGNNFLKWVGGYFEPYWSVNPFWNAEFKKIPTHAVTSGV